MIRRRIRDRRQYLHSKSGEASQRALFQKKRRIRAALEEGKPIPTELRNEVHELRRQIDLEDQETRGACCSRTPSLHPMASFCSSEWNAVSLLVYVCL
jgi:hypothetical protein